MIPTLGRIATLLALAVAGGCEGSPIRRAEASAAGSAFELERARQDSIVRSRPGYVVDSILPVEEEIRRFQATAGDRPAGLSGGAPSRSALVAAFVRAVEGNDTTTLARLVIDRGEFGHLIYPGSPNAKPPYRQSPEVVWLQRSASTGKGTSRLLARFGGRPLGFAGHSCPTPPDRQGTNTVWSGCVVRRLDAAGDTIRLRMFGPIVEHGGRFKFLSLTNGL